MKDDEQLFESGVIDSPGFIKLLEYIEGSFDITIDMPEVSIERFGTFNDIVGYEPVIPAPVLPVFIL